jgi:hypothetical protein
MSTAARPRPDAKVRKQFLLLGVILGLLWYLNGGRPLWEHALRMLLIMVLVLIAVELLARRKHGPGGRPRIAPGRIIAAKLALLVLAIGVEWILSPWTTSADLIVATGLAAVVALAGPWLRPFFLSRMPGAAGAPFRPNGHGQLRGDQDEEPR